MTKCTKCGFVSSFDREKCLICGGKLIHYEETPEELENRLETLRCKNLCKSQQQDNIPKCPLCQSPNIKQISAIKRAAHGYAFGLFSNTARSQWECLNCGNKF